MAAWNTGAKMMSFEEGLAQGLIQYVEDSCKEALYEAIESRSVRPGLCKSAGLKLVYSPLNGSGLVPVLRVLGDIGISDITVVPEQREPDGNFPTCPYPNPEIFEALRLGLELAKKENADLMLATDPDADRVGIAIRCPDGSYELVTGNEVGVLLLDYICQGRLENGTMPKNPVAVKSIVSTPLADAVAAHYGVEMRSVLTGFKWIGDQIATLEAAGEVERFLFGFEESYGYLAGPYVRDKDAIIGSMLICEMAAYYRSIGSSIKQRLEVVHQAAAGGAVRPVRPLPEPGGFLRVPRPVRHGQDGRHHEHPAHQSPCRNRRLQGHQGHRLRKAGADRPACCADRPACCQRADLRPGRRCYRGRPPLRHRAEDQDLLHHPGQGPGRGPGSERRARPGAQASAGISKPKAAADIRSSLDKQIESGKDDFCLSRCFLIVLLPAGRFSAA